MKRCPQCGREYPEEHQFCQQDAATLVVVSAVAARSPMPTVPVRLPRPGISVGLLIGLVLVTVGAGWQVLAHQSQPPAVASVSASATGGGLPTSSTAAVSHASSTPSYPATADATPDERPEMAYRHTKTSEWSVYSNAELGVQIEYPAGWTVVMTRYPERVRVQFTGEADVSAGLDVSPSKYRSLAEWEQKHPSQWIWGDLEEGFLKRKGVQYYRERIGSYNLGNQVATSWEFTLQPEGETTIRKWDVGTLCNGKGYALICEAPVGRFSQERAKFDHMIASVNFH